MLVFPRPLAIFAVKQLAAVDYTVANRVTEDVSLLVDWSYKHDAAWIPPMAMNLLQTFDAAGSFLIALVVWIVSNTQ